MKKKRINITIDVDVLEFINSLAESGRMERSSFLNYHFAMMMDDAIEKGLYEKPEPKPDSLALDDHGRYTPSPELSASQIDAGNDGG